MDLTIKKLYIDTRYKNPNSKSNSDFSIDLPRQFNIPDKTVCYVDDIILPVSWSTINKYNKLLYIYIYYSSIDIHRYVYLTEGNYSGNTFSTMFESVLNSTFDDIPITFTVGYNFENNILTLTFVDGRTQPPVDTMLVSMASDETLKTGWGGLMFPKPDSANEILNNDVTTSFNQTGSYETYLDLHSRRNIYLISSMLSNYDTVSTFGIENIIKKIPVTVNTNSIIYDGASEGFDYITVSNKSLRTIDFKLIDTFGNIIDMRNTHWSMSLVFVKQ